MKQPSNQATSQRLLIEGPLNRQAWIDSCQSSEAVRLPDKRALAPFVKDDQCQQSYLSNELYINIWTLQPYIKEAKDSKKEKKKERSVKILAPRPVKGAHERLDLYWYLLWETLQKSRFRQEDICYWLPRYGVFLL